MSFNLRLLNSEHESDNIHELNVIFTGSLGECERYAAANGFRFRRDQSIFGGYFVNNDGDCLMVTL